MNEVYTIETRKETLKFSAAHLATFADGSVERLHGHNYQARVRLSGRLDVAGMVLDVGTLKRWTAELCAELDERVLLALENPLLPVETDGESVTARYGGKTYRFPREDCILLPLPNTTMEHLARWLSGRLAERLEPFRDRLETLSVSVSETPGQSATWVNRFPAI